MLTLLRYQLHIYLYIEKNVKIRNFNVVYKKLFNVGYQ